MNKDIETGVPESTWHVLGRQIIEVPYKYSRISVKKKKKHKELQGRKGNEMPLKFRN